MSSVTGTPVVDEGRAWAWVAHLRAGGVTPWNQWIERAERAERTGGYLPGAQQLELLRRLNGTLGASGTRGSLSIGGSAGVPSALATRILEASAPGRGRPDLELIGTRESSRFGPRPIDPADLPDDELVRVATSVLADDLVAAGEVGVAGGQRPLVLNRPWRRHYRLVGDPVLADPLRAQLIARGRPPGGSRPRILVLGDHVETMLADAFEARALDTGGPAWGDWIGGLAARDHLAPRVDLAGIARTWAGRTSPHQVTIVLDPASVPGLVGVRRLTAPMRLSAEAVDLSRRIAVVLGLLVGQGRRTELLQSRLAPRLRGQPGAAYAVPDEHAAWLAEEQSRQIRQLRHGGYRVVGGDLDQLTKPSPANGTRTVEVDDTSVLKLAMDLLLDGTRAPQSTGRSRS